MLFLFANSLYYLFLYTQISTPHPVYQIFHQVNPMIGDVLRNINRSDYTYLYLTIIANTFMLWIILSASVWSLLFFFWSIIFSNAILWTFDIRKMIKKYRQKFANKDILKEQTRLFEESLLLWFVGWIELDRRVNSSLLVPFSLDKNY